MVTIKFLNTVLLPSTCDGPTPSKTTLPLLCAKVPLSVKFPSIVKVFGVEVKVPDELVKLPKTVIPLDPLAVTVPVDVRF